jgi:hypothetical protein
MKKQTAVQSFWDNIALKLSFEQLKEFIPELKKAKEMEKNQIKDAYESGVWDVGCRNSDSKKYYNETYGDK